MLSLLQQQHSLFEILRSRPAGLRPAGADATDVGYASIPAQRQFDPWLASVAHSPGLHILHEIASWWQRFQLESNCRYTARMLKRLGCFESCVADHFLRHTAPPSIEELTAQFLSSLHDHENPLVRAVSSFELFYTDAPELRHTTIVYWDRNPDALMDALDRHTELPGPEPGARYVLRLSKAGGATCVREMLQNG